MDRKHGYVVIPQMEWSFEDDTVDEDGSEDEQEVKAKEELWIKRKQNTDLIGAVLDENPKEVKRLLDLGVSPMARCQESMATVCHLAATKDDTRCLIIILNASKLLGIDVARSRDIEGRMPHHLAAAKDNLPSFKVLTRFDPTLINEKVLKPQQSEFSEEHEDSFLHNHSEVSRLLKNTIIKEGSTALHVAAKHSYKELLEYLIGENANLNVEDNDGLTPLDVAGLYADPTVPGTIISAAAPAVYSPQSSAEGFPDGFQTDSSSIHTPATPYMLQTSSPTFTVPTESSFDTLKAIPKTTEGVVEKLISKGAKLSDNRLKSDMTPLHKKVESDDAESIKIYLKKYNSDDVKKLIRATDNRGWNSLHLAVDLRRLDVLKVFLQMDNASVNLQDNSGMTPLHMAVQHEWSEGIFLLLQNEVDLTVKTKDGETVLHLAARKRNPHILRTFLESPKIKGVINATDREGFTALFRAIQGDSCVEQGVQCVEMLIDAWKPKRKNPRDGNTLLHMAVKSKSVNVLRLIIRKSQQLKMTRKHLNWLNNDGLSALHLSVQENAIDCMEFLITCPDIDARKVSDGEESKAETILHIAARLGYLEMLNIILQRQDLRRDLIGAKDREKREPLILAALGGYSECVTLLLQNGANLNAKDSCNYKTALDIIFYNVPCADRLLGDLLDSFMTTPKTISPDNPKYKIELDFKSMLADTKKDGRQMGVIECFIKCKNEKLRKRLFLHPLTQSFLYFKWDQLKFVFRLLVFIYLSHVFAMTGFALTTYVYNEPYASWACRGTVLIMTVPMLLLELLNARLDLNYLKDSETMVKWFVLVTSGIVCTPIIVDDNHKRYLVSITVLFSWVQLLFLISRKPNWGLNILMFIEVAKNVFQVFSTFIFLIIGFAFSFLILFNGQYPFTNVVSTMSKILIMMVELDYNGVYNEDETDMMTAVAILGRLLYLGFVILVVMVLTNLIVGMSVSDVTELEAQGRSSSVAKQAESLVLFEKICYTDDWLYFLPDSAKSLHDTVKRYRTAPMSTIVYPNQKKNVEKNPLPSSLRTLVLQTALNRDEQAEADSFQAKFEELSQDIKEIHSLLKKMKHHEKSLNSGNLRY